MESLQFKKWPFQENERIKVHWFRSPYRVENKEWVLDVILQREDQSIKKKATIPFGSLPWLRLGQYIVGGKPLRESEGYIKNIPMLNVDEGSIKPAIQCIPKNLYLLQHPKNYYENCWSVAYGNKVLVIPCIEIARALLAPSRFLANALIDPVGLQYLIDEIEEHGRELTLKLNDSIPKSYVTKNLINHFIWLMYNEKANDTWHHFYKSLYNPEVSLQRGNGKVQVNMPLSGTCSLKVRCREVDDVILVLEIIEASGLYHPFKKVTVEHGGKKVIKLYEKDEKATKNTKTSTDKKEGVLDDSLSPSLNEKITSHVKVQTTKLKFTTKPNVEILDSDKVATKRVGTNAENVEKSVSNIVTTVQASRGGKVKPVEFESLEVEFETKDSGLEDFMNAVRHLITNNDVKVLDVQVADLPGDSGISFVAEHVRRKFMYVLLKMDDEREFLVIEMGRPDYKSISTLVVIPKYDKTFESVHKGLVWRVIQSLIENRGSWNREQLNQDRIYKFSFMKHTKTVSRIWANRIYMKLGDLKRI
ncbi:Tn7-like element transposition protein TnsE [Bacillus sp. SI2]|uniref:Tn7-like element transposition protein TnsE n=1 Tax=Bacillus sp. SI2 TaxID=3077323 RepID=UPI0028E2C7D2|nr:Tn7-like element transposition protein TnsE [Bacillus sp. SI2]WNV20004.1 Tn7-like element transposition protein TnsE [Bacillus sp. SI2]